MVEAQVPRDTSFQFGQPSEVAAEQVEHVLAGSDRSLDPAQWVAGQQVGEPVERDEELLGRRREPLPQCRRLRSDVVGPRRDDQFGVLDREPRQPSQRGHAAVAH